MLRDDTTLAGSIIDILLPPACPLCERELCAAGRLFCGACHAALCSTLLKSPLCTLCGVTFISKASEDHLCSECVATPPPYARARSVFAYEGPVKEAIRLFKYSGRTTLGAPLGGLLGLIKESLPAAADLVMPVPLHKKRLRRRGFNQSLMLAAKASEIFSSPLVYDNLKRVRYTEEQVNLTHGERAANVAGAFVLERPREAEGKMVALVDDVYTTGATIKECAKVLKKAGAQVCSLTLARAIKV
ncbi:MAG: ComF family protein [Thermodesulfobacteriota bacterium]|nr:MAG: ComF family protein [Thermodesulfobacteriota bacterium]